MNKSIAFRAAVLIGLMSFVFLLCMGIGIILIGHFQEKGGDVAAEVVDALKDAVTRDDQGRLVVTPTPALQTLLREHPSIWYIVSDGVQSTAGGERQVSEVRRDPAQISRTNYAAFELKLGTSQSHAFVASRETRAGPVSIELGGLPIERFPALFEALVASVLLSVPLLVILAIAGVAALVIVPRLIARPVRLAAAAAEVIDGVPGGRRLPEAAAPTELRPLVVAFNRALERIDRASVAQRNFFANAAHELRTPLTKLRAHLEAISDEPARSQLVGDVQQISETVKMLLHLARLTGEPVGFEQINLVSLARTVVADAVPAALAEGVEIELIAPDHQVGTRGSPTAITTAIANLLRNAVRHGASSEPITVEILEPARIRVIDHGSGIEQGKREQVFQPFARGTTDREGVGLGLTIVAQVMALHEGSVGVEETPSGGSTFELKFKALR
ncbi:HAMP domain-containing sensor histidine kinase [Bradyrhizobium liaoningense]|uniref:sensor histidine kinase n=1 Tax=Bradyrhizobium liaoningense TaxID=43992 RepID=UPI001BA93419|nr:HAMP domain-containing sensor histidine kinase [Bradyrhizobium liaoningense]MBR0718798.1 HAMP domain-containing histidine kinase [Bradyrhizobium liaoningense]